MLTLEQRTLGVRDDIEHGDVSPSPLNLPYGYNLECFYAFILPCIPKTVEVVLFHPSLLTIVQCVKPRLQVCYLTNPAMSINAAIFIIQPSVELPPLTPPIDKFLV
ncbi:hypothetical protein EYC84_007888 [Monilinia fructicola]|uniref:Uncharacterized protein n=1 Tax=Monilinia fructicola TaxID=38448 RepID=A0A5M9JHY6_MONFR|nr:hypothetical protein EYC84_007888 [Monilinia fructicola]